MVYSVLGLSFIALLLLFNAIFFGLFYRIRPVENLKYYNENYKSEEKNETDGKIKISPLKLLAQLVPVIYMKKKKSKRLELDLIRAGILIKPDELFVIKVFSSSAISFLSYALSKDFVICLIVWIMIWNIPRFIIYKKSIGRLKLFDEQINEGIMIISNSLKAGYSFLQAVSMVAEETKDPFSKEFKKLLKEMSLGIPMEDSLQNMLKRVPSDDFKLIVNAILIQKDIGGNLSEILDNIALTIRERQKIQNELKTLTAQGKLSGMIIVLIPAFLGAIIYLFNKEYMLLLFTTKLGIGMTASAVISQLLGIVIINKIIKVEM